MLVPPILSAGYCNFILTSYNILFIIKFIQYYNNANVFQLYILIQDSICNPQNVHISQPCQDTTGVQTTVAGLTFKRNTC